MLRRLYGDGMRVPRYQRYCTFGPMGPKTLTAKFAEEMRGGRLEKEKGAQNDSAPLWVTAQDLSYSGVSSFWRPEFGVCVVGVTVSGPCRVKFNTVSEASLIC